MLLIECEYEMHEYIIISECQRMLGFGTYELANSICSSCYMSETENCRKWVLILQYRIRSAFELFKLILWKAFLPSTSEEEESILYETLVAI